MPEVRTTAEPGGRKVSFKRTFDAPRDLVFKTMTDPALVPQWWGPKSYTTRVEKMDVKQGGEWRYIQRGSNGVEHAFYGVYRDVMPDERLSYTFIYDEAPNSASVETVTFTESDGKTTVTDEVQFPSVEERDQSLKEGMESGAVESMERFADLVDQAKKRRFGTRNM
jgi:uncharacterized protein YndB with AHSA1/START domain